MFLKSTAASVFCQNSPFFLWQKSAGEISEGALETGATAHLQSMSKIEPQTDSGCHGMPQNWCRVELQKMDAQMNAAEL